MQTYASLLATNAREQWEKCFEQEYIQPVLAVSIGRDGENVRGVKTSCENSQSLDKQMGDAMNLIVNDKKEGHTLNMLITLKSLLHRSRSFVLHCI